MTDLLTIGELAAQTGVPPSTLRFWERRGLLYPTTRHGGQRRYAPEAALRVTLLRMCQDVGLSLAQIDEYERRRVESPTAWRELVEHKLTDIDEQIRHLTRARAALTHVLGCEHEEMTTCPHFRRMLANYQRVQREVAQNSSLSPR